MLLFSQKKLVHLAKSLRNFYRVVKAGSKSDDLLLIKEMSSLDLEAIELKTQPSLDFILNGKNSRLKPISINSIINKGEVDYNPEANLIFVKGCSYFNFNS